jgi:raffinose/stachyose/melibiose transport system substrate-binding protein
VTLTWWHNATDNPLKSYWQQAAADYTAKHPNVTFKIEPIQNESIQTKITVALQSNDPPDIFQQWGGGDLATQVASGKVQDITAATKSVATGLAGSASGWQVHGKQYGLPYSLGIVGFWYRTDLFTKAGISAPPATMDELTADITKLRAAGIAPISVGSKDKWPDAFYWGELATRLCSKDVLQKASTDLSFADGCFLKAGQDLASFLKQDPFQKGFLGTPAQQGAASSAGLLATGKAAMELQGHWDGGVITGLTPDKKPLGAKLSWFPFPAVTGGAGAPDASFGGGDGFSCSVKAPPACADFLNFLLSVDEQKKFGALNVGPPVAPGSDSSVSDPTLKGVLDARGKSSFIQLYFDKALPTSVGAALNDEIANMFANSSSPDKIVKAVSDAAASQ